uniref:OCEL domain-containing protein n=2 Tax=Equus TaxID=9789 RepID=A0A9L0JBD3_EQUAS
MPARKPRQTRGAPGALQTLPPGPGPPRVEASAPCRLCQPQPGAHRARPKKIVFEDELPSPVLGTKKSIGTIPGRRIPRPQPVPDYELKYPAVNSERGRRRYAAVFQDQYPEFLELQQEVGAAQAKLRQLEALLNSLPPPRSQVSHLVDPCRGLRASHWLQVSRPLPPPGWVGTTVHGSRRRHTSLPASGGNLRRSRWTPASWTSRLAAAT